jgi:hypothetical protein
MLRVPDLKQQREADGKSEERVHLRPERIERLRDFQSINEQRMAKANTASLSASMRLISCLRHGIP